MSRVRSIVVAVVASSLVPCFADAQRPLNLDFERLSVDGALRPWGWSPLRRSADVDVRLDDDVRHAGERSLRVSRDEGESVSTAALERIVRLHIPPRFAWGRRVRVQGWIRPEHAEGGGRVTLETWAPGVVLVADTSAPWLEGTRAWTPFELSIPVDSVAMYVVITIEFRGRGTVWYDDLTVETGGHAYEAVPVASEPSRADIAWLARHTDVLRTVDAPKGSEPTNDDDLAAFAHLVGDARVIALGEDTHGTSEFFRVKHRLTRFMVEQLDARVFAIEANQLAVTRINEYVHGGPGDPRDAMRAMFRVWNTEEMLEMIEWMRLHNARHPDRTVDFVGFDMQDPSLPIDSVVAFLDRTDPPLRRRIAAWYEDYREAWRRTAYPSGPDSVRTLWKLHADSAWWAVSGRREAWLGRAGSAADSTEIDWVVQHANVVRQAALSALTLRLPDRDSAMAANIEWILERVSPTSRLVVWAHNAHVARGTDPEVSFYGGGSMGGFLSTALGDHLRVFGLVSYDGHYSATASFLDRREVAAVAFPAPLGTVEEVLHRIARERGTEVLLADLRPARTDPVGAWLLETRPTRLIGYAAFDFDWETMVALPHVFDALVFVDHATASKLLPRRR
jgi:erythromycin esterase